MRKQTMDADTPTIERDKKGRFRPGCSGNPAGKKTGTRNRATILREALREGEAATVARVVIDKALAGDAGAARFLLERLEPKPRGRPIHLEIPEGESPAGEVVATFNAALRAMAAGEITPDEALSVARFLEGRMRVLKAWKFEQSLTRWDNPLPIPGDDRPSPIPYPPPKEGWPSHAERGRLWGAPWPPPAASVAGKPATPPKPSPKQAKFSSPPVRGEKDAQGWRGAAEPYPKLDEGGFSAREVAGNSGANGSAGAAHPHPPPERPPLAGGRPGVGSASLSLRNPPEPKSKGPQAGEGKSDTASEQSDSASPPLFSPHLRGLIEAGMADPADNRWLAVLDEEWGLKGRLALHLPSNSRTPAAPGGSEKTLPPAPQPTDASAPRAGDGKTKVALKSAAHLHSPSISRPPLGPSIGWEQRVPPRSRRPTPRVVRERPR
jgi:hypothetical protein